MKLKLLLFVVPLFALADSLAKGFPLSILKENYATQYLIVDSIARHIPSDQLAAGIEDLNTSANIAAEKGDHRLQMAFAIQACRLSFVVNKNDQQAEKKLIALLKTADEKKWPEHKAEVLENLAEYYWENKNFAAALENYIYAYETYKGFPIEDFPQKPDYLYSIGGRYYYFRDYHTARKYFLEVWQTIPAERVENQVSKLNTLALCYSNMGEYDSSNRYFLEALQYAIDKKQENWIGIISGNMGNNYLKQNRIDDAIPLLEKNIRISRDNNLKEDLVMCLSEYGSVLLMKNEARRDLDLQTEALAIIYEKGLHQNNTFVSRVYPNVARAYAANGDMNKAYRYLDSATRAKEIVDKEKNMVFVSGVQHKIDVEKHMAEIQAKEVELKHQKDFRNSVLAAAAVLLLFTTVFFIQRNRIRNEKKISDAEKQRSEELLLNILPEEVAAELKATGGAEAKSFENVSVLFTDFVNFTQLSEKLTPQQLVQEIHYCFTAFDKIIERNGLEKIKTIGDAYLAVCGMPVKYAQHAQQTVRAALEIRSFMLARQAESSDPSAEIFAIRIGINSGPVVAGIVGVKKFAYDIWGDTVNTAARMEQHSEQGKINISGSTYALVKNDFNCAYRGKIEAKNKGKVDMYFVEY